MSTPPIALEENEERWWGLWCRVHTRPWGLLYHNPAFDEPVFNHATRVMPGPRVREVITGIRRWFEGRNLDAHIYVTPFFNEGAWEGSLTALGYRLSDELVTLLLTKGLSGGPSPSRIVKVGGGRLRDWASCYCRAFYGDTGPVGAVLRALRRVEGDRGAALYAAMDEDRVVGVAALYRSENTLGLYCLGTIPEYRGRGIGRQLVRFAAERARRLGVDLTLQTFRGDGLVGFYEGMGFSVRYVKKVYTHFRPRSPRSAAPSPREPHRL
jgi:GNAT superfamily N-acetyltransferase